MKLHLKSAVFCVFVMSAGMSQLHAFGSRAPANPTPAPAPTPKPDAGNAVLDLGLTFAIIYAKQDPRYSTILTALNINNAQDVRNFLKGNETGRNFGNIISRLAFAGALNSSEGRQILERLGINNEQQLRDFINGQGGGFDFETLLALALSRAQADSKYATWLRTFNIRDVQDLRNLLRGGSTGNLQSLVVTVGLHIVRNNKKLEKYVPYIEAAMVVLGLYQGADGTGMSGGSDDDIINLGAFNGMTIGETRAIRQLP